MFPPSSGGFVFQDNELRFLITFGLFLANVLSLTSGNGFDPWLVAGGLDRSTDQEESVPTELKKNLHHRANQKSLGVGGEGLRIDAET